MDQLELEVINILRELEIPAHVKGYQYIKSAAKYLHGKTDSIYHITKELYPETGRMHGEDIVSRVERGIRHAIGLSRANDATWYRVLGRTGPMPNGEFLATLIESVKIKMATDMALAVEKV